jgi:hypothetical protein
MIIYYPYSLGILLGSANQNNNIHAIRNNNVNSGYSNHILNMGHTYGIIMDIMTTEKRGKYLNTSEKYLIYKISKDKLNTNDKYMDKYNPIFEILHQIAAHTPQSPI